MTMTMPAPAELPFVTVIAPVFNGAACIDRLLDSLEKQDYPASRREFIIVDDASTDSTVALVQRRPGLCVLARQAHNRGSYAARNVGIERSRGTVLAFVDADCAPLPNWISEGVKALQAQGGGLIAGAVRIDATDPRDARQRIDQAFGIQQKFFALRQQFGATANLFVCRKVLDTVAGFDATVRSGGDKLFCLTSIARGAAFGYCATSEVAHAVRGSYRELLVKQTRISLGHVKLFPRWSRFCYIPLSCRPIESFDHHAFCRSGHWVFRLRFRVIYYSLEAVHLTVYAVGCMKAQLQS